MAFPNGLAGLYDSHLKPRLARRKARRSAEIPPPSPETAVAAVPVAVAAREADTQPLSADATPRPAH